MKSTRDGINFTLYQLAKMLNMPHSVLLKLIHHHPSKRVKNPRIDTLSKIVEFFKTDGFDITINDLLMGLEETSEISLKKQKLTSFCDEVKLPLYSFSAINSEKIGMIPIKLTTSPKKAIVLLSDEEIKYFFKKDSLFIVDIEQKPENENLVAVKMENHQKILIRKLCIEHNKKWLKSIDNTTKPVILSAKLHTIIGVIIQINAKT
ncbi:S24 family peptidase [Rickettsiella endosymbiont of Dermanyssus gallinae]|uniref:S24 family peptidase n=1 Tax=Rickettsiella endosymbiont of Dermanyssus gallinae TaxID=2856608 RepID=UPI001C52FF42|nr:S24 family peptidase [Rickettsiella endosymbiont of Dermanyssus gallinae]